MIKIVNDTGAGAGTQFLNAGTGEEIKLGVTKFSLHAESANAPLTAKLDLVLIHCAMPAGAAEWRTKHPVSGEMLPLARITFKDGSSVGFSEDGTPEVSESVDILNAPGSRWHYRAAPSTPKMSGYAEARGE